jgi:hypothetical protein
MGKLILGVIVSFLVVFMLLSGGQLAIYASWYLWFAITMLGLSSLLIGLMLAFMNKATIRANHKGWTSSQLVMMHPFARGFSFVLSIVITYLAYQEGFEITATVYGILVVISFALTASLIGILKGK